MELVEMFNILELITEQKRKTPHYRDFKNEFWKVIRNHASASSVGDEGGTPPRRISVLASPIPQWGPYAAGRDTPLRPPFISFKIDRLGRNPARNVLGDSEEH